ncbi:5-(carboxyamino)imidazole ribonucleotide mutase [Candidatus Bathyarchaeota archaeon]|nr:5-(carboxyamino)imidazole ribonucleotide mutase [Candidatus Bathyarchaeota archaeon]MBS7629966.1 5-(carboxyamino)imidazole ribonucleotide mutase [Candidatus Bathyarchaeota archaeon]
MVLVSVIMGSTSDRELGEKAASTLKEFGVDCELRILSAHRTPKELAEYVEKSSASIYIAIAGLSAALPGFIAAHTLKPVIGVPKDVKLGGLDSLLSIVQMPPGVPVACVGIDSIENAVLLAVEILSLADRRLEERLKDYRLKIASFSSRHI